MRSRRPSQATPSLPIMDAAHATEALPARQSVRRPGPTLSGQQPDGDIMSRMPDPVPRQPRRQRIEVRVSAEQDALIREAAAAQGVTVTSFLLSTATEKARAVVRDHRDLVLPPGAYDRFLAELDKPGEVVPEMVELFAEHRRIPQR